MKGSERFPVPAEWFDDEASMFADSVGRWADREVIDARLTRREEGEALYAGALQTLMEDVGLGELLWPEEGDGEEAAAGAVLMAAVLEQAGRADVGLGVALASTWALRRFIPAGLASELGARGGLAALVLPGYGGQRAGEAPRSARAARAERGHPGAAFHGLRAQVTATADGEGWRLSSRAARPLVAGAGAALFGVVCEVDDAPAIMAVPGEAKGLRRGEALLQTGLLACPNADLELRRVAAPAAARVASGVQAYHALRSWLYLGAAAVASGALLATWRILDDWADARVIKGRGQPFKDNPLVASLLGDLGERVAVTRLLVYALARQLDTAGAGAEPILAQATACARTALRNAMDGLDGGMELMASAGYATEWSLERYWRDVQTLSTQLLLETAGRADLARAHFGCRNLVSAE
jgi:alkylation response protein AidB-like acyl-CoA dehydrogenase